MDLCEVLVNLVGIFQGPVLYCHNLKNLFYKIKKVQFIYFMLQRKGKMYTWSRGAELVYTWNR